MTVARMVALQPAFLACHTAAIRARAEQLAHLLSVAVATPRLGANSYDAPISKTHTGQRSIPSNIGPGRPALPTPAPPPSSTTTRLAASTTAAVSVSIAPPRPPPPPAAATTAHLNDGTRGGGRNTTATTAGSDGHSQAVTPQAAMELIARQPALLQVSPNRLVSCCAELAGVLGVAPQDACLCLTRMRPEELARMLQASQALVRESWLALATVIASLEQPGLHGPPLPQAAPVLTWAPEGQDSGQGGLLVASSAQRATAARGGDRKATNQKAGDQRPGKLQPPFSGVGLVLPPRVELAARGMVLLCPLLLMLPPGWVRASALHLRSVLGLTPAGLRRLLSRSPRLLLLPKRHREEALQAVAAQLALHRPEDAARLVSKQPSLLKWTPEGLRGKLEETATALGLSRGGVARLCRSQPALLAMSSQSLAAKLLWLQALLRLPDADTARRLVLRQPAVLTMSSATLERKVRLLPHGLGLSNAFVTSTTGAVATAPGGANGSAATARALRAERGFVIQAVLRMVVEEPTVLTLSPEALPQRLEHLAEVLDAATLHEARAAVMECPRLLLIQRAALRHRLQELAWGLDAPPAAVKRLVLAWPRVLFRPLSELRAAVSRAEAAGAGRGMRGRKSRVAAALDALAADSALELWNAAGADMEVVQ
ncbi:hypothetical protein VOLCADRAFT_94846 [Volvox carteri f. nagariensis]|uniref:Uncharacterized protein n=1 Tax=Volvox carteri f. nagariensis TaxID=3068 RepID=D8U5X5_VOLCA|nr:uncharacterized protein VOLCADRAFT_94846 [Volvox carteri f. nagariensis]EFJ44834.1 hypothetical protein VOLCADRAFT_94846 [Volvox carteri f. nagariensis]|eukprot:XP_002954117.1 hypothetical protein VOLCADRAFT_94846 [Volvox carteri f. nagariensis]